VAEIVSLLFGSIQNTKLKAHIDYGLRLGDSRKFRTRI